MTRIPALLTAALAALAVAAPAQAAIQDGTSNTIAFPERAKPQTGYMLNNTMISGYLASPALIEEEGLYF
jgi:hypothetical protein